MTQNVAILSFCYPWTKYTLTHTHTHTHQQPTHFWSGSASTRTNKNVAGDDVYAFIWYTLGCGADHDKHFRTNAFLCMIGGYYTIHINQSKKYTMTRSHRSHSHTGTCTLPGLPLPDEAKIGIFCRTCAHAQVDDPVHVLPCHPWVVGIVRCVCAYVATPLMSYGRCAMSMCIYAYTCAKLFRNLFRTSAWWFVWWHVQVEAATLCSSRKTIMRVCLRSIFLLSIPKRLSVGALRMVFTSVVTSRTWLLLAQPLAPS